MRAAANEILPPPGGVWTGWLGSSVGLALAAALSENVSRGVVVCPREEDARRLLADTRFFLKLSGRSGCELLLYPPRPSDLSPARLSEPHVGWERLAALHRLLESPLSVVLFTSLQAAAQLTLPKPRMLRSTQRVKRGDEIDRDALAARLHEAGYDSEALVEETGSFAVRGAIVDLFPPGSPSPFRLEFDGDIVASIRHFDPETQRSTEDREEVAVPPCREVLLDEEAAREGRAGLKTLADGLDLPRRARAGLEESIRERRYVPAFDNLLPIFYPAAGTLYDYLPPSARFFLIDPLSLRREREELRTAFRRAEEETRINPQPLVPPARLSVPLDEMENGIAKFPSLTVSDVAADPHEAGEAPCVALLDELREQLRRKRRDEPLRPLLEAIDGWRSGGFRVLLVAPTDATAKKLVDLLTPRHPQIAFRKEADPSALEEAGRRLVVTLGDLHGGFRWDAGQLVLVTEEEIFGHRKQMPGRPLARGDAFLSIGELSPGDVMVHVDHGLGIYRGLERLDIAGAATDFLHLEYEGGDKLYLPIYRLNKVQKYVGAGGQVRPDRLGNRSRWGRKREEAARAVAEMARDLVRMYAARKIAARDPYGRPDESYVAFESEFPYEETPDQLRAIEEISADLELGRPMDRLVCGDVGFGKTEVALRTAFRATMDGKQVAVLVPTTILAQQHFETFRKRFEEYPIRVEYLSRFKSAAEQSKTVERLASGDLDIVIGTHRLLSEDVTFRNLGLLVIDEEHRFGVRHKDRIRRYRSKVDVITLTATPIPRTLQMSIAGIRDLSVINTPPPDRKAIATHLCRFDDILIQGAVRRELSRGGQIFFVHNRIDTIDAMARHLRELLPGVRLETAHGRMSEARLERTMLDFLRHEFDLLLCTTIVESGLDIPNANTILVNRADTFGLAQLYQLRGRVGRSDRNAYAYLLIPGEELVSRDALKRLKVLKRFAELGSGLKVALHDLEIRGAGNLLGPSQSGHIAAVGFELYASLLEREVRRLKGEPVEEEVDPEILVAVPAFLPDDYVPATGERLILYKRLSSVRTEGELEALRAEVEDRFGPPPSSAANLFRVIGLKILARRCRASSLRLGAPTPSIEFAGPAAASVDRLLALARKDKRLSFRPDRRLVVELAAGSDAIEETQKILRSLL